MVSTPPPHLKLTICTITQIFDHWQLFQKHTRPQFLFLHNKSIVKVSYENLPSSFHTTPCLWVPPSPNWLFPQLQSDHCQLFPQHTWLKFIVCHNIGIVKVSHKKINIRYLSLPCLCVPPQIDYLHNAQLHSLWPLPTFSTAYLAKLHILPQHRHCEGLSQEINIHFSYSPCLCACTPQYSPQWTICTITYSLTIANFFYNFFHNIGTWPEFIFCHNIGIVKVSHTNLTSDIHIPRAVCVYPPQKKKLTICTITKSLTIANFSTIYLATQFTFYPNIGIVKNFHIKILNLLSIPSPCLCVAPP